MFKTKEELTQVIDDLILRIRNGKKLNDNDIVFLIYLLNDFKSEI